MLANSCSPFLSPPGLQPFLQEDERGAISLPVSSEATAVYKCPSVLSKEGLTTCPEKLDVMAGFFLEMTNVLFSQS